MYMIILLKNLFVVELLGGKHGGKNNFTNRNISHKREIS